MVKGRSLELDVRYAPNRPGQTAAVASASEKTAGTLAAGTAVELDSAPLYVSSDAQTPAGYKTGTYFLYDGLLIRGRYRITNTAARCGKTPVGKNVTGWIQAEDCTGGTKSGAAAAGSSDALSAAINITDYVESMTYEDSAADDCDSIELTLNAQDAAWLGEWMPRKGAALYPKVFGHDWDAPGDERRLDCGVFVVDDICFSDTPTVMQLGGVSKPNDSGFSEQERAVVWQNTSVKRIGQTIADRYGLGFSFDGDDHAVVEDEQDGTDSAYYNELCKTYGLVLKVYAGRLWVYDREAYKAKPPVRRIDRGEMLRGSVRWETTLAGTYTGGVFAYSDPDTGEDISYTIGGGTRVMSRNQRASSVQDAAAQLCAALNEANHGATTLRFSLPGAWGVSAGQTITVTGFGSGTSGVDGVNGIYFLDKVTQTLSRGDGMTTAVACSRVETGFPACAEQDEMEAASTDTENGAGTLAAGTAVELDGAPLYVSSDAQTPAGYKTGTYFLYDGLLIRGRYRITNTAARCGKTPVGKNVTGWIQAEDCVRLDMEGG